MLKTLAFVTPLLLSVSAFAAGEGPQEQALDKSLQMQGEAPATMADQSMPGMTGATQTPAKKAHQHVASAGTYEGPQERALDRGEEPASNKPDPQAPETAKLNGGY
jgi:hypothetical protein